MTGLEVPWSIAFTSPTRMLVAERSGRVRVVENGVLQRDRLARIEDVESTGETGLMGLAVAPDDATSRGVYLWYASSSGNAASGIDVRVARYRDEGHRLVRDRLRVRFDKTNPARVGFVEDLFASEFGLPKLIRDFYVSTIIIIVIVQNISN